MADRRTGNIIKQKLESIKVPNEHGNWEKTYQAFVSIDLFRKLTQWYYSSVALTAVIIVTVPLTLKIYSSHSQIGEAPAVSEEYLNSHENSLPGGVRNQEKTSAYKIQGEKPPITKQDLKQNNVGINYDDNKKQNKGLLHSVDKKNDTICLSGGIPHPKIPIHNKPADRPKFGKITFSVYAGNTSFLRDGLVTGKFTGGLRADWAFAKSWSVFSNIGYAGFKTYDEQNSFFPKDHFLENDVSRKTSYKGEIRGISTTLGIQYNFSHVRRVNWYSTVGLSGLYMYSAKFIKTEKDTYYHPDISMPPGATEITEHLSYKPAFVPFASSSIGVELGRFKTEIGIHVPLRSIEPTKRKFILIEPKVSVRLF